MRKDQFNERLQALLDARQAPEQDAELLAQAALDDDCRQTLAAQELLLDGLAMSEVPDLPPDFAQRVVALARSQPAPVDEPTVRRPWYTQGWLLSACAASLLLVIATAVVWQPANHTSIAEPGDAVRPAEDLGGIHEAPETSPEAFVQPSPVEVAGDRAPPLVDEDEPLLDELTGPQDPNDRYDGIYGAIVAFGQRLPTGAENDGFAVNTPQWVDEVAVGLKPVATSVGGAINVLRRNLPPVSRNARGDKPQANVESLGRSDLIC